MKKWFITLCAFGLFATAGTQANATPIQTEDVKQKPLYVYTISFNNVNGLIFRTFEKLPLLKEEQGNAVDTINLARKTAEKIVSDLHKEIQVKLPTEAPSKNPVEESEGKAPNAPTEEESTEVVNPPKYNEQTKNPFTPVEEIPSTNGGNYYFNQDQVDKQWKEIVNNFFKQYPSNGYNDGGNNDVKQPTPAPSPAPSTPKQPVETPTQTPQPTAPSHVSDFERQVVELTNAERAKAGLAPLEMYGPLMSVAEAKSQDMANLGYFSHTSPTYGSPFDQIKAAGIQYRAAGENIAQGQRTPEQVVNAWMNSPGHRANILNASYTHIGVGFVENGYYWTQQFIQM